MDAHVDAREPDDITRLILDDHEVFRRDFARLDDLRAEQATRQVAEVELSRVWDPLADLLDLHAIAEEEREALADFRLHAAIGLRQSLGRRFRAFKAAHRDVRELDTSLGIGSLKGR